MVKRVQFRFWLIAMCAMGFCVVALIGVMNLVSWFHTDRELDRALDEMVHTVESLRDDQLAAAAAEPEWRVESYVEEPPTPSPTPEVTDEPRPEDTAPEEGADESFQEVFLPPKGQEGEFQPKPGRDGKPPWWYQDLLPETETSAETSEATEETVINHYYYYYPAEESQELDLRSSAMNQYAGRLCVVTFDSDGTSQVGMSDSNALGEEEAAQLAEQMLGTEATTGDLDDYRFRIRSMDGETWVFFLDCTTELQAARSLLTASALVGLGGLLVMGVFVYFMARKAMAPLKESVEKQRR